MEEWEWVIGFAGKYEVSTLGRVKSYRNKINPKILKPSISTTGYYRVTLFRECKGYERKIHRLLLEAFREKRPKGMDGIHLNGDKLDNRLENLAWAKRRIK